MTAIEELVNKDVDVNSVDSSHLPSIPLIVAAFYEQLSAAKSLGAKGTDVNMKGWMEIVSKGTNVRVLGFFFHAAVLNKHWDIARYSANAGTNIERAVDTLHQWVNKQPNNPEALAILANTYLHNWRLR